MTSLFIIQGKPFKSLRLNCSDISSTVIKILTYYLIRSYLLKRWNLVRLHHWCFPCKFMNFSEAATGGVLWKKMFLKISQYSQESCRPATLSKRDSNTVAFLWILLIFKNTCFEEHLLTVASDFLKQLQNTGEQLLLYWLFYEIQIIYLQVMNNYVINKSIQMY